MAGRLDDAELDEALRALTQPDRFRAAESRVAAIAPQLQHVLASVLREGGYFDAGHESEVNKIALEPDEQERLRALKVLLADETRLGMMIGVAVGWELGLLIERGNERED